MINIYRLILSVVLLTLATTLMAQIPEDCAERQQANGWPEYYCDCKYTAEDFINRAEGMKKGIDMFEKE